MVMELLIPDLAKVTVLFSNRRARFHNPVCREMNISRFALQQPTLIGTFFVRLLKMYFRFEPFIDHNDKILDAPLSKNGLIPKLRLLFVIQIQAGKGVVSTDDILFTQNGR